MWAICGTVSATEGLLHDAERDWLTIPKFILRAYNIM